MSITIEKMSEYPAAAFYVVARDNFSSGWRCNNYAKNLVVLLCDSYEEAQIVSTNAKNRELMSHVRINKNPPRMKSGVIYSLMHKDFAQRWYRQGGFS